jgi:pimeloyl-ACP methyl ester carboxylesterase
MKIGGFQIKSDYAEVNGVKLHYASRGKGKLILFLHGFPEFWYAWKKQLEEFGRDYQAVAPDMRGYNLSSKPAELEKYRLPHLVEDVRALALHLGHKKFILVGHDWGGAVAWGFSLYHPDMLEKLIIINAPHPTVFERELRENPDQQKASQYMLLFRSPQAEQMLSANHYNAFAQSILGEGLKKGSFTEADKEAYLKAWSQPGALTGGLNYYRANELGPPSTQNKEVNLTKELPTTTTNVPTLVIWGEKDPYLLTGNLNGLEKHVPKLTVKRIPDGTHWVIHEQPEQVNRLIREFIQKK